MLILVTTVALLFSSTYAQERCSCAMFTASQIESGDLSSQLPLSFAGGDVAAGACDVPAGSGNDCFVFCNDWYNDQLGGNDFGFCQQAPDDSKRCYGGVYCELLYIEGYENVTNEQVDLHYRLPDCPNDLANWQNTDVSPTTPLCCDDGIYTTCTGIDCDCYDGADDRDYCECGVFVPEQLEGFDGETAVPLAYIGEYVGPDQDPTYCLTFGQEGCRCLGECTDSGDAYFSSYTYNDTYQDSGLSYGQFYCQSFFVRGIDMSAGLTTTVSAYQRAIDCNVLEWIDVIGVAHPDVLCCDSNGDWIDC